MRRPRGAGGLWWTACASSLVALAGARTARADPLDLAWDAPDTCSTAEDVRRDFERSTRILPGRSPSHLSATAHVEVRDGRWVLRLHTVRGGVEGDREIEADSCASLTRAAALVLALAYGEGAEPEPAAPSEPPPPPTPPPVVTPPAPLLPTDVAPSGSKTHLSWSMTVDGRVAWGPLPGPTAGAATSLDVHGGWWGASARVTSWPDATGEPQSDLRTHFSGVGGSLSMCLLAHPSRDLLFSGCAGMQASALRGTSSGATVPRVQFSPWYAAPASVRARVRLVGSLHIEAGFELAASIPPRPTFTLLHLGPPVYVVPELSPSTWLGLALDI